MDGSNEDVAFPHHAAPSKKGGEYVSAGIPPAGRGHHFQPYQQQQQQQQQHQQLSSQQFVEQQQLHQLQQRAPRRDDVGGIQVGPEFCNQSAQYHIAIFLSFVAAASQHSRGYQ